MLRSYDDWRAAGPHEDMPSAEPEAVETCEVCGETVAPIAVAQCDSHFSYWPQRPERDGVE